MLVLQFRVKDEPPARITNEAQFEQARFVRHDVLVLASLLIEVTLASSNPVGTVDLLGLIRLDARGV